MGGQSFPRSSRLLSAGDYRHVFENADIRLSQRQLLLLARPGPSSSARLGLVFAKKHLKLSVDRNRFKRMTRELFRRERANLPAVDIVVIARQGIAQLDNSQYRTLFAEALLKLKRQATRAPKAGGS